MSESMFSSGCLIFFLLQAEESPIEQVEQRSNDGGGRHLLRRLAREVSDSQHNESTSTLQSILALIAGR